MAASRVVVVVPRRETRLHEYLRKSFACVDDVEIVLDRRATNARPAAERRRPPPELSARSILMCSLVRCAPPPPAPSEPPAPDAGRTRRTLLWPGLRVEHL